MLGTREEEEEEVPVEMVEMNGQEDEESAGMH